VEPIRVTRIPIRQLAELPRIPIEALAIGVSRIRPGALHTLPIVVAEATPSAHPSAGVAIAVLTEAAGEAQVAHADHVPSPGALTQSLVGAVGLVAGPSQPRHLIARTHWTNPSRLIAIVAAPVAHADAVDAGGDAGADAVVVAILLIASATGVGVGVGDVGGVVEVGVEGGELGDGGGLGADL